MRFWPEQISDEEFVQRLRASQGRLKRWRWVYFFAGVGMVGVAIAYLGLVWQLNAIGSKHTAWFVAGAAMGFLSGVLLFQGVHAIMTFAEFLQEDRKTNLLLQYHDAIKRCETEECDAEPQHQSQRSKKTPDG
jgi:hypothetical protein